MVASELNKYSYNVLDIGCNQGQLAKTIEKNVTYLGIDVAHECVNKASQFFKNTNNITFSVLNGEDNKLKNASFDAVTILFTLSVSPDPHQLIKESCRLLKPGGKLYVVNHFSSAPLYKKLDYVLGKLFYAGVNFYFPISLINQTKDFNIVKRKKINLFWTYLELEKI